MRLRVTEARSTADCHRGWYERRGDTTATGSNSVVLDLTMSGGNGTASVAMVEQAGEIVFSQNGVLFGSQTRYSADGQIVFELDVLHFGLPTTAIAIIATFVKSDMTPGPGYAQSSMRLLCNLGYVSSTGAGCSPGYHSAILGTEVVDDTSAWFFTLSEDDTGEFVFVSTRLIVFIAGDTAQFALPPDFGSNAVAGLSFDQEIRLSALAVVLEECQDGIDNDHDGFVDFPNDPGCVDAASDNESPQCQDGLNNDGQLGTDFDGGVSAGAPADPDGADPNCASAWDNKEAANLTNVTCGLGPELAVLLPLLLASRARRRLRA